LRPAAARGTRPHCRQRPQARRLRLCLSRLLTTQ
jgi:hypothetical protein